MALETQKPYALPKGIRYYLLRGSAMVPLVPVDQLPFQLQAIPRNLTHRQMSDEEWKLLKETEEPMLPLSIQAPNERSSPYMPSTTRRFLAPDHVVRNESMSRMDEAPRSAHWSNPRFQSETTVGQPPVHSDLNPESSSSLVDSFASIYHRDAHRFGYHIPYPSGIEPDLSKKEYCTHWIKTGECAFVSVGCKYKHEMPMIDKLRELGFSQVPKWWKEKSAITTRGPTWMQRRLASGKNEERPMKSLISGSLPSFSTFRSNCNDDLDMIPDGLPSEANKSTKTVKPERLSHTTTFPGASAHGRVQESDLLIDFHEQNIHAYGPQLSGSSSSNAESCCSQSSTSSRSASPAISPAKNVATRDQSTSASAMKKLEQQRKNGKPVTEIIEHVCLSTYTSDENDSIQPISDHDKIKNSSRSPKQQNLASSKKSGLSVSKYAYHHKSKENSALSGQNGSRWMP